MSISVALAYYNGEKYIKEQVDSILPQLGERDELIISVDGATEDSRAILNIMRKKDERIRIVKGPGKGVVQNVDRLLRLCGGDIIFLADQDDVWASDKVEKVMAVFNKNPGVTAVLHDAVLMDGEARLLDEKSMFSFRHSRTGMMKNIIRNSYVGCCMAFRRELVPIICPIPKEMYMHDFWIGMVAEQMGEVRLIHEPLLYYRRHEMNVTDMKHGSLGFMLEKRLNIIRCMQLLKKRIENYEAREGVNR